MFCNLLMLRWWLFWERRKKINAFVLKLLLALKSHFTRPRFCFWPFYNVGPRSFKPTKTIKKQLKSVAHGFTLLSLLSHNDRATYPIDFEFIFRTHGKLVIFCEGKLWYLGCNVSFLTHCAVCVDSLRAWPLSCANALTFLRCQTAAGYAKAVEEVW